MQYIFQFNNKYIPLFVLDQRKRSTSICLYGNLLGIKENKAISEEDVGINIDFLGIQVSYQYKNQWVCISGICLNAYKTSLSLAGILWFVALAALKKQNNIGKTF